jgi:hypothetical protein
MKLPTLELQSRAERVRVRGSRVVVRLAGGRNFSFPWRSNAKLHTASPEARSKVELIRDGTGLHWPELDEDLSLPGILEGRFGVE